MTPSVPPATCVAVVESGNAPPHEAEPPNEPTLAEAQVTVTAEIGTVGQFVKVGELDCTVRLQLPPLEREVQVRLAVELPATTGALFGLVALKVMVAGETFSVKLAALGVGWVIVRGFSPPVDTGWPGKTANSNAMGTRPLIGFRWRKS